MDPDKLHVTFFPDETGSTLTTESIYIWDLRDRICNTAAATKDQLPWLKLATFGDQRSEHDSLRHNANVTAINGVEGDYDGEQVGLTTAITRLKAARIHFLVYTSPSHTPTAPRWRVLAPTSRPLPPEERSKLVARLNGVLGGILSGESFTLSQSYYYGKLNGNGQHRCDYYGGDFIDQRPDLDGGAAYKQTRNRVANGPLTDVPGVQPDLPIASLDDARLRLPPDVRHMITTATPPKNTPHLKGGRGHCRVIGHLVRRGLSNAQIKEVYLLGPIKNGPMGHSRGFDGYVERVICLHRQPRDRASAKSTAPLFDPWERFIVPEFPLQVLPLAVQGYVTSQSVVIGCDRSALAMAALTAFSGALDHRFAVKMMRNGNWWEHPRLWTLLVGDPSRKKTPIINDVIRPLERHQNDLRSDYEAQLRDYEAAKEGEDPVEKPDPPVRYVVWDIGEILSRSEHGLLVKRDEFSGWIGGMEKYSNASRGTAADRGFWLQSYDGGPHTVDRIGRGEIYIGNLSVSLIGGIQPAKLAELHGLTSDGLLQRFLPVMMRPSTLPQDCEGDDWENFHALVYKLIKAKHQRLLLSNSALSVMNDLRAHLQRLEEAAAGLTDGLQAFIGKLPGVAGRLAVILHMAALPHGTARPEIMLDTVEHVRTLVLDFIVPHAVEFYRSTEELTGGERLRKIASWIVTSQQQTVTSRDLVRNVACLRGVSVFDLHTVISPLVAAGWLEPEQRGPDNRTWTVSPMVAAQFKRQRQVEEERKMLVAELMGSPRKPGAKMSTS